MTTETPTRGRTIEWEDVRLVGLELFAKHPQVPTLLVAFFRGERITQTELSLPAPRPR